MSEWINCIRGIRASVIMPFMMPVINPKLYEKNMLLIASHKSWQVDSIYTTISISTQEIGKFMAYKFTVQFAANCYPWTVIQLYDFFFEQVSIT